MGKVRLPIILSLVLLGSTTLGGGCSLLPVQDYTQITLEAKPTDSEPEITPDLLDDAQEVVSQRIEGLGVNKAKVKVVMPNQLQVDLPGMIDPLVTERVLSVAGYLSFRRLKVDAQASFQAESENLQGLLAEANILSQTGSLDEIEALQLLIDQSRENILDFFEESDLTGAYVQDALAQPTGTGESWEIVINFDREGAVLFAELTQEMAGTGRAIGIFLDHRLLSAPVVDAQYADTGIEGGSAVISGNFDTESAKALEIQLRSGALPVPFEVISILTADKE